MVVPTATPILKTILIDALTPNQSANSAVHSYASANTTNALIKRQGGDFDKVTVTTRNGGV